MCIEMKYPIFLNLKSKRAVVVGGGSIAARKVLTLLGTQARVVVVADQIDEVLKTKCKNTNTEFVQAKYSKEYLAGATIVFAATNDRKVNEQIYKDCQQIEALCNVADEPELCDFFVPAVVKRGDLQIAVGTDGYSPAYAGHIRQKLENIFTEKHGEFLAELEIIRKHIMEIVPDPAHRKALLGELVGDESFKYFVENGPVKWQSYAEKIIKSPAATNINDQKD
jgi:precorrin-2 dehydrogenase/sirohydrochlorin ferrochelatase